MSVVVIGLLAAIVAMVIGCAGWQGCRTAEEQEYFDFIALASAGMAMHMDDLEQLTIAYEPSPVWAGEAMDTMVEVQRAGGAMALYSGPPSTDEIRYWFVRQSAYLDEFLVYYAAAIQHGMDAKRIEKANRALQKSDDAGAEAIVLMTTFAPPCQ